MDKIRTKKKYLLMSSFWAWRRAEESNKGQVHALENLIEKAKDLVSFYERSSNGHN